MAQSPFSRDAIRIGHVFDSFAELACPDRLARQPAISDHWAMIGTRRILLLGCVLAVFACSADTPGGPTARLNEQVTLAPGEVLSIAGTPLRVEFLRVSGDSRCPTDVVCIQGGDAIVHVRASTSTTADYELHTGDQNRARAAHGSFNIALVQLQPYPFSGRTIEQTSYRATISVSQ